MKKIHPLLASQITYCETLVGFRITLRPLKNIFLKQNYI